MYRIKMRKKELYLLMAIILAFFVNHKHAMSQSFQLMGGTNLPALGNSDVSWADFNNDGYLDVVLIGINPSGSRVSALYKNNNDSTFTNLGIGLPSVADGAVCSADINNDGWIDILLTGVDGTNVRMTKVFKNNGNETFTELNLNLEGAGYGSISSGDYNNDGFKDIFSTGLNAVGDKIARLYKNNKDNTFSEITTDLEGVSEGTSLMADFNNDGYQDIMISGLNNSNQRVTDLYINNKNGSFSKKITDLPKLRSGDFAYSDFNNDGFLDIVVSGSSIGGVLSKVYKNNQDATFSIQATLLPMINSSLSWGDFDGDGDPDLVVAGYDDPDYQTIVYENISGTSFNDLAEVFTGAIQGGVQWADYNGDSKLDFLLTGYSITNPINNLYSNDWVSANTAPQTPTNLQTTSAGDSVVFSWDAPSDTETPSAGLSYGLYIGTAPGYTDVVSPLSDITNGYRRIAEYGDLQSNTAIIKGLAEGTYYWGVQAIDHSYAGSPFSAEQSFIICHNFSLGADTSICYNENITLEAGDVDDDVRWFSAQNPATPFSLTRSTTITITKKDTIWAELTKQPLGCVRYDTIIIDVSPLPVIDLGVDTALCYNQNIVLQTGQTSDVVNWYSKTAGLLLSDANQFDLKIVANDTIIAEVQNVNGCVNYDTINIAVIPLPIIDLGGSTEICLKENLVISTGTATDSVNWYSRLNGALSLNTNDLIYQMMENDTIRSEVYNQQGCVNYDTLIVNSLTLPIAKAGQDTVLCLGQSVAIGGDYSGVTGLEYYWNPTGSLDDSRKANPIATPELTTSYYLKAIDQKGCESPLDTLTISMNPSSTIVSGNNSSICIGQSITLGGNPTATGSILDYSYQWSPDNSLNSATDPNPLATPVSTTTYSLITSTSTCVIDTSYVTVTVNPLPIITTSGDITIGFDETTQLNATGGVSYEWMPFEGLSNANIYNPVASPGQTTQYFVLVTDVNQCQAEGSLTVSINNSVFIPNLFTPNGDGNNDTFKVYGFGIKQLSLKVYNRWGQLVYENNSVEEIIGEGWDGRFDGIIQENGNYIWSINGISFDDKPIQYLGKNSGTIRLLK
jgi:gliding motility-associated-like protein